MPRQKLFYGGLVITENPEERIYKNGWLLIQDDFIVDVGGGELPNVGEDVERVFVGGKAVLPGIVNIHTHICGSLFKALTEDNKGSFMAWLFPWSVF